MKKEATFSLKDHLFNKNNVAEFAQSIQVVYKSFNSKKFQKDVLKQFPNLELKQRIEHMVDCLEKHLTGNYKKDLKIILKALPKELDPNNTDDDFGRFIWLPFSTYISRNGLDKENLKISLAALSETTKRFSAEGDIRFFINKYPKETFAFMKKMSTSKNYHQRRLASEGLRPKLPWCIGITFPYQTAGDILEGLYFDKTRYVTRSVANHTNDISKIDPDYVLNKLQKWEKSKKQNPAEMEFIKNHSLRTLIKDGHKSTLNYLGYGGAPKLGNIKFSLDKKRIKIGQNLEFSFQAESLKDQALIIDYKIHFQTKSGKLSTKVFKIKKGEFKKGERISITKKYSFALKTTKAFYPGEHRIDILINGEVIRDQKFSLVI